MGKLVICALRFVMVVAISGSLIVQCVIAPWRELKVPESATLAALVPLAPALLS
ncbi:MAG: hypothetical protein ABI300_11840 [Rhodanobacter sp.]